MFATTESHETDRASLITSDTRGSHHFDRRESHGFIF